MVAITLASVLACLGRAGLTIRWLVLWAGLVVISPAFTVWSVAGLENALSTALVAVSCYTLLCDLADQGETVGKALLLGALAGALAMTRPDGLLYVAAYPVGLGMASANGRVLPAVRKRMAAFLVVSLALLALLFQCRLSYFGAPFPNTLQAKVAFAADLNLGMAELSLFLAAGAATGYFGAKLAWRAATAGIVGLEGRLNARWRWRLVASVAVVSVLLPERVFASTPFLQLGYCVAGKLGLLGVALVLIHSVIRIHRREASAPLIAVLAHMLVAALILVALPKDWMKEYRFGTPFIPMATAGLVLMLAHWARQQRQQPFPRTTALAIAGVALGLTLYNAAARSAAFRDQPSAPFADVARLNGHELNRLAERFGVTESGSIGIADIGGALYYSRLRVHDLAGLADREIARRVRVGGPPLRRYVLEQLRPTFIRTKGYWTYKYALEKHPRFAHDYVPLMSYPDEYAKRRTGESLQSGLFVRRELAEARPAVTEEVREELRRERAASPRPPRS